MLEEEGYELLQALRAVYKDETLGTYTPLAEIVKIKPWSISKSGEHIILWDDIKAAFENPVNAMSKGVILPLLTDKNSEALQPLRISVDPGVVLDIVVGQLGIEAGMESLQIQSSSPSSSTSSGFASKHSSSEMPAAANISSPSTIAENVGQPQQPRRTWQDGDDLGENIMLSKPEPNGQSHQLVPDYKDNSLCCSEETGLTIGSQHYNDVFVYRSDEWDADEDYLRGVAYYEGKSVPQDYVEALDLFLRAANRGHALAQMKLRNIIASQHAVEHDYSKVYERYLEAANQGCADAQSNLGFLYQVGCGVTKDEAKAVEWYRKATEQGHIYAHCDLGFMYDRGLGVTQDYFKAVELYRISADAGYARAQNGL
ncbi:hypothetical protein BGX20_011093, partial [Mortierella sp. AD010]